MAVGLHAVNESRAVERGSAVVIGCGPVGLATITALRLQGVPLVVAADFSPARRELAARVGAHVVVDPQRQPAVDAWREAGGRGPTVLFEAVGVPGLIDAAMQAAPPRSEVVVVGLCMQPDRIEPTLGISKQLTVRFVLGWTAEEFRDCLDGIAGGGVDVAPADHRPGGARRHGGRLRRAGPPRPARQDPRPSRRLTRQRTSRTSPIGRSSGRRAEASFTDTGTCERAVGAVGD